MTAMTIPTIDLGPESRREAGRESGRLTEPAAGVRAARGLRQPTRRTPRPGRGAGRGRRPQARPPRPVPAPSLGVDALIETSLETTLEPAGPAPVIPQSSWRLTQRGVALVVVAGLMIVAAAVTVITLTAVRVTGDHYVPYGQSQQQHR